MAAMTSTVDSALNRFYISCKLIASCCDSQYETLISKSKLQIGCRNKLAINLQLM
ncbi:hypothetical protein ALC53_04167 [Atta colombica]|uniref:Uncharacterized protein n=1 Tax=Atta colombica TaxID=520822 RepID=A0A195BKY0_9HYME|nr:hypothetical protein ALC53_04167 [Atta colombica]